MEIKIGLWQKKSQKGNTYYSGKFQLDNKNYYLTLFKNDKKGNEKAPNLRVFIKDSTNTLEKQENQNKGQINIELGQNKVDIDQINQIYADFGKEIEYTEDDFPF